MRAAVGRTRAAADTSVQRMPHRVRGVTHLTGCAVWGQRGPWRVSCVGGVREVRCGGGGGAKKLAMDAALVERGQRSSEPGGDGAITD